MADQVKRSIVLDDANPTRIIQVAGTTNPKALAGSIMEEFRQAEKFDVMPSISMHAIGHQAVAQGLKAVPIVNGLLAPKGLQLTVLPTFCDREIQSEDNPDVSVTRTVLRMRLLCWQIGC